MDDRFDPMEFLLLSLSFAGGLAFVWAAIDALLTGRVFSVNEDRTGLVQRSRQAGSFWLWIFIYTSIGGLMCGFAIFGAFFAPATR